MAEQCFVCAGLKAPVVRAFNMWAASKISRPKQSTAVYRKQQHNFKPYLKNIARVNVEKVLLGVRSIAQSVTFVALIEAKDLNVYFHRCTLECIKRTAFSQKAGPAIHSELIAHDLQLASSAKFRVKSKTSNLNQGLHKFRTSTALIPITKPIQYHQDHHTTQKAHQYHHIE